MKKLSIFLFFACAGMILTENSFAILGVWRRNVIYPEMVQKKQAEEFAAYQAYQNNQSDEQKNQDSQLAFNGNYADDGTVQIQAIIVDQDNDLNNKFEDDQSSQDPSFSDFDNLSFAIVQSIDNKENSSAQTSLPITTDTNKSAAHESDHLQTQEEPKTNDNHDKQIDNTKKTEEPIKTEISHQENKKEEIVQEKINIVKVYPILDLMYEAYQGIWHAAQDMTRYVYESLKSVMSKQ